MYLGVRVPVAFYKVVGVVDDAKGQLAVTAFEMDQSNVMPPQPGAPIPRAPFDPGRFSLDQVTLSEVEERSGLDLRRLKKFRCWPSSSALDEGPRGCAVGSLNDA
jgi:DNA/RNA endonuclease G (NUC1)